MTIHYRPEIDGLRAVAVLLVLFCHLGLFFRGGFVGVDVFFVISGFLITSIIVKDIEAGKFNMVRFYWRRIVRLYPALLFVVLLTCLAGFLFADPQFLNAMMHSGMYVIGSASNIHFSEHQDYFDIAAIQQPFLHTWTLGVEWQFYLLAPVVIFLLLKGSRKALWAGLLLLGCLSLIFSQMQIGINVNKAYYLMPYRAFELIIGAAIIFFPAPARGSRLPAVMTVIGLVMMITAGLVFRPKTPFPGLAALLPVLGAALCIYGGKDYIKGNILRFRPLVYLGKISYSVYLVHWPLIVFFYYIVFYRDITGIDKTVLLGASIALGALVYHFIEVKINNNTIKNKPFACAVIVALSMASISAAYLIQKYPDKLRWRTSVYNDESYYEKPYQLFGNPQGQHYATFIADSMGYNYGAGMDKVLKDTGYHMKAFYGGGCYMIDPEYVFNQSDADWRKTCLETARTAFESIRSGDGPVIVAQAWEGKTDLIEVNTGKRVFFNSGVSEEYQEFIKDRLAVLRKLVGNRPLILIGSPPYKLTNHRGREYVRLSCADKADFFVDLCRNFVGEDYPVEDSLVWELNEVVRKFAEANPNTWYIDPAPVICPDRICNTRRDDMFYRANDMNHFTVDGSVKVSPYIWQEIVHIIGQ